MLGLTLGFADCAVSHVRTTSRARRTSSSDEDLCTARLKGMGARAQGGGASSGQRATQSSSGGPSEGPPTISARIQSLPDRKTCF